MAHNLPRVSGVLSMLASALLIYSAIGVKKLITYHRLLITMSAFDIATSFWVVLSTVLAPRDSGVPGARGTTATCTVEGFFSQQLMAIVGFNASLCVYYVLTIKYSFSDTKIVKRVEPYLIAVPILFSLSTGLLGVAWDLFNPVNVAPGGCYISGPYPYGCENDEDTECLRGVPPAPFTTETVLLTFLKAPFFFYCVVIFGGNTMVFFAVRRQMRIMIQKSGGTADILQRRIRAVGIQCTLYVGAFTLTYVFTAIVMWTPEDCGFRFPIMALHQWFHAFRGVMNLLVYIHPRYGHIRYHRPEWTLLQCFWAALRPEQSLDPVHGMIRSSPGTGVSQVAYLWRPSVVTSRFTRHESSSGQRRYESSIGQIRHDISKHDDSLKDDTEEDASETLREPEGEAV